MEPRSVLTPPSSIDQDVYRPVSGLAITGLALSILYAGLVLVSALADVVAGSGFFLGWAVLLAILGAGLSLVALGQIRRSEGTRAGFKVAQWGFWLSLVSALGYNGYVFVTGLAVKAQANHFL